MRSIFSRAVLLFLASVTAAPLEAQSRDDRGFDPTGTWMGHHGPLALVRAGDTLSFSYSAAFGALELSCDGIGVAGFVGDGKWEYVDERGTVTFTTKNGTVKIEATRGFASFCGPKWPGETFGRDSWKPAFTCKVTEQKVYFLVAGPLPPPKRKGFVLKGDVVEAVGLVNESSAAWLLVRYQGKNQTTAGLIERDALACQEE